VAIVVFFHFLNVKNLDFVSKKLAKLVKFTIQIKISKKIPNKKFPIIFFKNKKIC